jgi:hypothetical protein
MINLIIQLSEITTCREVDKIVESNIENLNETNRNFLCHMANSAKKRITRINREKKESYKDILN